MEGVNPIQKLRIGIDLGGSSVKIGLINSLGSIVHSEKKPTPIGIGYKDILLAFTSYIENILKGKGLSWNAIDSVGVGVPAFIDYHNGIVLHVTNLGWKNVSLQSDLQALWKKPVFVDNDANLAALGESWKGAGRGYKEMLCVTIGTGIGGGLIINGHVYHGAHGMAGEIGHITSANHKGRLCNCGNIGCLETEVSARAIAIDATELAATNSKGSLYDEFSKGQGISTQFVIRQALEGDADCQLIIRNIASILGTSLGNIAAVLNPERIIIGGGVSHAGELLMNALRSSFMLSAPPLIAEQTTLHLAQLGNQAGMIGAARLAELSYKAESIEREG
ncbi:hypothetical protein BHU72_08945 [Desulfuribacillus stibiiarsenatis]|uniref:Glucokinase n=1 Tax=Desulfuribacillus stibiiarsenatis TaxID=1390249 RepID=A0A1E5L3B5_9FIRM|nr:ROK family glucokinase [Desulfuribacillus stibiiarsenatis]OEH84612.1 hypothetical protein BHU72_08945 [Desulfuribacillus stibiiarsenatis]